MALFPVSDVGKIGLVEDVRPHELPLNAWSLVKNARCMPAGIGKIPGQLTALVAPIVRPYYLLPVPTASDYFWIGAGLAKVYAYNALSSGNITRQTASVDVDYAALAPTGWSGGVLGGVPVIANEADIPQMWLAPSLGARMANLTAWPSTHRTKCIRPFKNYLVAFNITKSGVNYPTLVKWSHAADPGTVPSSWNEADPAVDAGEYPLSDTGGAVVDGVLMRDSMIVYKEDAIYEMQYVGGVFIFKFRKITSDCGMPVKDCAVEFQPGKHIAWTGDDLIMHDGQSIQSILQDRVAYELTNINSANYQSAFMVRNSPQKEVWFCWGEDSTNLGLATKALIWNWKYNTFTLRDLNLSAHIAAGYIDRTGVAQDWASDGNSWDSDLTMWDDGVGSRAVVNLLSAEATFQQLDTGATFNGAQYDSTFERTGLGVPFKEGQPPDISSWKMLRGMWPRITGTVGETVLITIGTQESIDRPVVWGDPLPFVIGQQDKVDCICSGRLLAVRFKYTGTGTFQLHGYSLDVAFLGSY